MQQPNQAGDASAADQRVRALCHDIRNALALAMLNVSELKRACAHPDHAFQEACQSLNEQLHHINRLAGKLAGEPDDTATKSKRPSATRRKDNSARRPSA